MLNIVLGFDGTKHTVTDSDTVRRAFQLPPVLCICEGMFLLP